MVSSFTAHFNHVLLSFHIVRPTCSPNYSVRLVGGKDSSEGRLEVCYGGFWSALCGAYTHDQYFASVACNQLGFTGNNCMFNALMHY